MFAMNTPLEQFKILILKSVGFFFFNTTFYFFLFLLLIMFGFFEAGLTAVYFLAPSIQHGVEILYYFLCSVIVEQATKKSNVFFTYLSSLFFFILFANYIGMVPMGFTLTSHIMVTFSLGLSIIVGLTLIGFLYLGLDFINLFIPKDINLLMMPLLIVIEVVSYISRGFSLSIRLFANIMAGHTLLNILSSFIFMLTHVNKILMVLTSIVVFGIVLLEIALAFLQAYVFTVLTCIYLHDSIILSDH